MKEPALRFVLHMCALVWGLLPVWAIMDHVAHGTWDVPEIVLLAVGCVLYAIASRAETHRTIRRALVGVVLVTLADVGYVWLGEGYEPAAPAIVRAIVSLALAVLGHRVFTDDDRPPRAVIRS